jgi:hypothetical protein
VYDLKLVLSKMAPEEVFIFVRAVIQECPYLYAKVPESLFE